MEFIKVSDCSDCPCLSRCNDECTCNLGYSSHLLWREDKELIYCASDCKLDSVICENQTFKKVLVKATYVRPEHWTRDS